VPGYTTGVTGGWHWSRDRSIADNSSQQVDEAFIGRGEYFPLFVTQLVVIEYVLRRLSQALEQQRIQHAGDQQLVDSGLRHDVIPSARSSAAGGQPRSVRDRVQNLYIYV
jgi:hypothetical protein